MAGVPLVLVQPAAALVSPAIAVTASGCHCTRAAQQGHATIARRGTWTCYGGVPSATNVVTLWASSESVKELLVTVTAPSSLSFLVLEVVYRWTFVKFPLEIVKVCDLAEVFRFRATMTLFVPEKAWTLTLVCGW